MSNQVRAGDLELSAELVRRLRQLEDVVPPEEMGDVWIFPPLEEPEGSREFVLFTRVAGDDERAVYSARHRPGGNGTPPREGHDGADIDVGNTQNGKSPQNGSSAGRPGQAVVEHGRAPADRVPGLVEALLRRVGDERAPAHVVIDGSRRRWDELVTRVAGADSSGDGAEAA